MSKSADEPHDRIASERDFHNRRFTEETRKHLHPFYRAVEHGFEVYRQRIEERVVDRDVLEYGCASGRKSLALAGKCRSIVGIDISDVAIDQAVDVAKRQNLSNATFYAMNAEKMALEDEAFDFVFGSSILHHLSLEQAYSEIARVLRPGGSALFLEPLGHNPVINKYRDNTPASRTPDEHPFLRSDVMMAKRWFKTIDTQLYGLTTLAAIPLIRTPLATPVLATGRILDKILIHVPGLRWWAWFSVLEFKK